MARYIDADALIEMLNNKAETDFEMGLYNHGSLTQSFIRFVEGQPTADVVPRSEVERLVDKWIGAEGLTNDEKTLRLIEALKDEAHRYERYYFNHEYDKMIAESKAELAREIFEEIESKILTEIDLNNCVLVEFEGADEPYNRIKGEVSALCKIQDFIAELKKKYTEET